MAWIHGGPGPRAQQTAGRVALGNAGGWRRAGRAERARAGAKKRQPGAQWANHRRPTRAQALMGSVATGGGGQPMAWLGPFLVAWAGRDGLGDGGWATTRVIGLGRV